ncbi:MAG TPA: TetR/AcrR family transcriptional regulator [Acidimicrobiales bacterium]|nr:TetR/AcrR family transcriptional regulator [Acidimicrobiales bacterium]
MIDQATAASTKDRLVEGTVGCLRRRGLAATTSRDIAAEAGVNLAAITYHFGSKDELVAEALLDAIRRWLEPVLAALRGDADPAAKLAATLAAALSSFERLTELLPVYLEGLLHARRAPSLAAGLESLRGEVCDLLAAELTRLRDAGTLPAWLDPTTMTTVLVALTDGLALRASLEPSIDAGRIADQVGSLLLSAGGDD